MAENQSDKNRFTSEQIRCAECQQPLGDRAFIEVKRIQVLQGYNERFGHTKDYRQIITRVHLEHLLNTNVRTYDPGPPLKEGV